MSAPNWDFFINKSENLVKLSNSKLNSLTYIMSLDNKFLTSDSRYNLVHYIPSRYPDIRYKLQKWTIEKDRKNNYYYIRSNSQLYTHAKYLGCPNKNERGFLYTSKNEWTRWKIIHVKDNIYNLIYVGTKFNPNKLGLIVARYNENTQWALAYDDIATIYNKGKPILYPFQKIIELPNKGREGNTYLYHIVENYNCLPDKTVFSQGDPFPHNQTILYGIDNSNKTLPVQPLGHGYLKHKNNPPPSYVKRFETVTKYGLKYLVVLVNNNYGHCKPYHLPNEWGNKVISDYKQRFPKCESIMNHFLKRCKIQSLKPIECFRHTSAALFSADRYHIQKNNINIYKNILEELTRYSDQGYPEGYLLERLWLYILEK
jgi:Protein of unknown function (DUF3431)